MKQTKEQIARRLANNSDKEIDNAFIVLRLPKQRERAKKLKSLSSYLSERRGIEAIVKVLSLESFRKLYGIQERTLKEFDQLSQNRAPEPPLILPAQLQQHRVIAPATVL